MKRSVISPARLRAIVHRVVMCWREASKKRNAKKLYNKLWQANDIILKQRHHPYIKDRNAEYFPLLEHLADELESAIVKVKKDT